MTNETIIAQAAAFKTDARKEFEVAVAALIALAFRYKHLGANFLWDSVPDLEEEANASEMVSNMKLFGGDARSLYELDREYLGRVYTQASPLAGE